MASSIVYEITGTHLKEADCERKLRESTVLQVLFVVFIRYTIFRWSWQNIEIAERPKGSKLSELNSIQSKILLRGCPIFFRLSKACRKFAKFFQLHRPWYSQIVFSQGFLWMVIAVVFIQVVSCKWILSNSQDLTYWRQLVCLSAIFCRHSKVHDNKNVM